MHGCWWASLTHVCAVGVLIPSAGAAIGALGRHTHLSPDGFPVFDHRMEVMFEVGFDGLRPNR